MTPTPFSIERFGGLNLAADQFEVGASGAVDLLNVDITTGALRTRQGTAKYNTTTSSGTGYQALYPGLLGGGQVVAIRKDATNKLQVDVMQASGGGVGSAGNVTPGGSTWAVGSIASIGTASTTLIYISVWDQSTGRTIVKTDGSTASAGTGKPAFVATWPTSSRIVQGNFLAAADAPTGANGTISTVMFSDPGAPDTFTSSNWVELQPGDGEGITAIVPWREMVFVFKQSAVYVFTGESIDSTGSPVFAYRRVSLPDPLTYNPGGGGSFITPNAIARRDGVYFSTFGGIYKTTGDVPVRVDDPVWRIFSSDPLVATRLNLAGGTPPILASCGRYLIASYLTAGSLGTQLVRDDVTGQWTLWRLPCGSFGPFTAPPAQRTSNAQHTSDEFFIAVGNDIHLCSRAYTDDNGTPIAWSYQTGRYEPARGSEAVMPETSLVGYGTVTLALSSDLSDAGTFSAASASVTLGTSPAVAEGWPSGVDQQGTNFQATLSGSGAAVVSELRHHVSSVRQVSNAR